MNKSHRYNRGRIQTFYFMCMMTSENVCIYLRPMLQVIRAGSGGGILPKITSYFAYLYHKLCNNSCRHEHFFLIYSCSGFPLFCFFYLFKISICVLWNKPDLQYWLQPLILVQCISRFNFLDKSQKLPRSAENTRVQILIGFNRLWNK